MPLLKSCIAKNFDDRNLLSQKLLNIILQIIHGLQSWEILELAYQLGYFGVNETNLLLSILYIETA